MKTKKTWYVGISELILPLLKTFNYVHTHTHNTTHDSF